MPLGGVVLLTLAALVPTGPSALPVRVEFDAPAGCSSAAAFFDGVLARATHVRRARPGEAGVRLSLRLARSGGKVHGELRVTAAGGEADTRRVDGATCAEVVQVLALTAALAVDPTADLRPTPPAERAAVPTPASPRAPPSSEPSPSSSPSTPAPAGSSPSPAASPSGPPSSVAPRPPVESPSPEPTAAALEPPPPAPRERPSPRPDLAVHPRQAGASPRPSTPAGAELGAALVAAEVLSSTVSLGPSVSGRFTGHLADGLTPSIGLGVLYMAGDFLHSGDDLGVRWTALVATVCPGWALRGRLFVEPCARATAGLLQVTDHTVTNPRSVDRWWESAGALVHAALGLPAGLGLDATAGVDFPFITHRFTTSTPAQSVGATPRISPVVTLGLVHGL